MKPIDISQIGKTVTEETLKSKQTNKTTDSKFEEILESELGGVTKQNRAKVDNIMPQSQLLLSLIHI